MGGILTNTHPLNIIKNIIINVLGFKVNDYGTYAHTHTHMKTYIVHWELIICGRYGSNIGNTKLFSVLGMHEESILVMSRSLVNVQHL